MKERALSLDLDGVIYSRPPIQTMALAMYFRGEPVIYRAIEPIPTTSDVEMSLDPSPGFRKRMFHATLKRRKVATGVKKALETLRSRNGDIDIFGNTGRPYEQSFVETTEKTLKAGGIHGYLQRIYYKPNGMETFESKLAVVSLLKKQYTYITHVDDNPIDGVPIAATFPDVNVVILQDLTTGILFSRREQQRFPNIRRVATFQDAVLG